MTLGLLSQWTYWTVDIFNAVMFLVNPVRLMRATPLSSVPRPFCKTPFLGWKLTITLSC